MSQGSNSKFGMSRYDKNIFSLWWGGTWQGYPSFCMSVVLISGLVMALIPPGKWWGVQSPAKVPLCTVMGWASPCLLLKLRRYPDSICLTRIPLSLPIPSFVPFPRSRPLSSTGCWYFPKWRRGQRSGGMRPPKRGHGVLRCVRPHQSVGRCQQYPLSPLCITLQGVSWLSCWFLAHNLPIVLPVSALPPVPLGCSHM